MSKDTDWKALQEAVTALTEKHAQGTGRAISAWNLLQDTLGRLFAEIVHPSNRHIALAIWYSQENDRAQRKMLAAAAQSIYGEQAKLFTEIKWICESANTLAENRNNVAHVGYSIDLDPTLSRVEIHPRGKGVFTRADKMSARDIFSEMDAVEKCCKALVGYAVEIATMVAFPEQRHTWPGRPSLPKAPVPPTPTQKDRQRPKERRSPPPESSRA